jgi:hypothetical protein
MEENVRETFPRTIPRSSFIEIGQSFSNKNIQSNIFFDDNRIAFPIPECEKQIQIITFSLRQMVEHELALQ